MYVRPAQDEDVDAMAHVIVDTFLLAHMGQLPGEAMRRRKEEWTYDVSANAWLRTLREIADAENPLDCVFVACDEAGEVIGLAMGTPAEGFDRTGEVCVLYVRPEWQRRGVGRRLVQSVAQWLRERGFIALHIATLPANAPARKFYEAIGGVVIGQRELDEYGYKVVNVVYSWPDIRVLTPSA